MHFWIIRHQKQGISSSNENIEMRTTLCLIDQTFLVIKQILLTLNQ